MIFPIQFDKIDFTWSNLYEISFVISRSFDRLKILKFKILFIRDFEVVLYAIFKPYEILPHLTRNNFEKGGGGGGPSECNNQYHSHDTPFVAFSTGWFNNKSRSHNNITITANGWTGLRWLWSLMSVTPLEDVMQIMIISQPSL